MSQHAQQCPGATPHCSTHALRAKTITNATGNARNMPRQFSKRAQIMHEAAWAHGCATAGAAD
eukprot:1356353-Lingulodinium_polyedra.AAC.1